LLLKEIGKSTLLFLLHYHRRPEFIGPHSAPVEID